MLKQKRRAGPPWRPAGTPPQAALCRRLARPGPCLSVKAQGRFLGLRGGGREPAPLGLATLGSPGPAPEAQGMRGQSGILSLCPFRGRPQAKQLWAPERPREQHACQQASCKHFLLPSTPSGLEGTTVRAGARVPPGRVGPQRPERRPRTPPAPSGFRGHCSACNGCGRGAGGRSQSRQQELHPAGPGSLRVDPEHLKAQLPRTPPRPPGLLRARGLGKARDRSPNAGQSCVLYCHPDIWKPGRGCSRPRW